MKKTVFKNHSEGDISEDIRFLLICVHPETTIFRMELLAVSRQQSGKTSYLKGFANS